MSRLLLLFVLVLTAAACGDGGESPEDDGSSQEDSDGDEEKKSDPRPLVEVAAVETGAVADYLVSTGSVESEAQADLVPEATGTVTSILVEEGDLVSRGQTLAIIENTSLDAGLARARAELSRAELELEQVERLHGQGAVSDRELQDARYGAEAARTTLKEAEGSAGKMRLTSPIAGTVAVRDLRYGEVAGGQRAFQVVDLDRLEVVVKLPERDLPRLRVGQLAELTSVYDEESIVLGSIVRISPTVDAMTGTIRATVALEAGQSTLRPGQFVSVRIEVDRHEGVLVVPRRAVRYDEGEPFAFRIAEEEPPPKEKDDDEAGEEADAKGDKSAKKGGKGRGGKGRGGKGRGGGDWDGGEEVADEDLPGPRRIARKIPLVIGFQDDELVEVVEPMAVGEQVVVVGTAGLRDGVRVRLTGDPVYGADEDDKDEDADAADGTEPAADGTEPATAEETPADASGAP